MSLTCIADCPSISLAGASAIVAIFVGFQLKNWLHAAPMTVAVVVAAFIVGLIGQAAFGAEFDIPLDRFDQGWVQELWLLFSLFILGVISATSGLVSLFRSGQRLIALASFATAALAFTTASAFLTFEIFERAPAYTIFAPTRPSSPLLQAVWRKDFAGALALVSSKGDWTKDELTDALIAAAEESGGAPLLRALLERGADPNVSRGNLVAPTALMAAANSGYPQNVAVLLKAKADLLARNYYGGVALHVAVRENFFPPRPEATGVDRAAVIELLVKAGTPVDIRDYWQRTTLIWNSAAREYTTAKLIALGADVNAQDSDGSTPLMIHNNPRSTALLLAAGANPFIRDLKGRSVRDERDDAHYLPERPAIVAVIDRWIAANPAAARRAEAEAERIGTSRVMPVNKPPEPPFKVEDITPYDGGGISPIKYIGLVLVTVSELAIVTLLAWIGAATLRRLGVQS